MSVGTTLEGPADQWREDPIRGGRAGKTHCQDAKEAEDSKGQPHVSTVEA